MVNIFITYFTILIVLLLLFLVLGSFLLTCFHTKIENRYASLFLSLLTGNVCFVLLASIFFTKGVTINLAFLIVFIFLIDNSKKYPFKMMELKSFILKIWNGRTVLEVFVLILIIFVFKYFSIYSKTDIPLLPNTDQVFYSNVSDFMMQTGLENISMDYTLLVGEGVSPYHYFEIWQNAGTVFLFSANSTLSFTLITITSGMILIVLGLVALLSELKQIQSTDKWFCLAGLFLSGFSFGLYKTIPFFESLHVYTRNAADYPKLIPLYLFLIAAFLFFLQNRKEKMILVLLCLPIVSIASSIGILTGIFSFLLMDRIWKKEYAPRLLIATLLVAFYIFAFYKLFNKEAGTHISTSPSSLIANVLKPGYLMTSFNIIAGASIQFGLVYLPFVAFVYLINPGMIKWRYEYWGILLVYGFALSGWAVQHDNLDSVQVFSNLSVSLFNVLAFICLLSLLADLKTIGALRLMLAGVTLVCILQMKVSWVAYRSEHVNDPDYLKRIHFLSKDLSSIGAFMLSKEKYEETPFSYVSNFVILGDYLVYAKYKTLPTSISPFEMSFSKDSAIAKLQREGRNDTPFFVFVEEEKNAKKFSSIEQSQVDFIKKYHINYIIATKDISLSPLLKNLVREEIKDKKTGEHFFLLKRD
ncbi:MAG TPA: hypothetical protein VNB90_15875 [Cytophagaceae bacterium]|nr:hypothetical protein [Cytophagaceae bacterium]